MSSVEGEFESNLIELRSKTSGSISGSRINKLVALAVQNVGLESKLISILYSNCKAAPSQNKIATMYVVDAIVRAFTDEAKKNGETIDSSAPEGTYASGVAKISELIESLFDDAMELQFDPSMKNKFSKLVDLWKRVHTFSPEIITNIEKKYFGSTTPPGSPPRPSVEPVKPKIEYSEEPNSILSSLASIAKSSTPTAAPVTEEVKKEDATSILSQLSALSNATSGLPAQPQHGQTQPPKPDNGPYILGMLQQMQQQSGQQPPQQHYQHEQQYQQQPPQQNYYQREPRQESGYTRRNRSRSPNRNHIRSPRQQHENPASNPGLIPVSQMGGEMNTPGTQHYRQRNVGFDNSVPPNTFKVLSRTLFIGGVPRNMDERSLASVLRPFAEVQSVILNSERKHAFVKVYSRREAEQVITSFNKDGKLPLRTRWGVGFGPRDCCNYQHGISMIPMTRLTEADKAWVVNAQWGGTGGQPLQAGMVLDEPDIEIGTGISSKAMSKKMPTNSARNGPKSNKPGEPDEDFVKTTLLTQPGMQLPQSAAAFSQPGSNPLAGLFANANQQQQQQAPQPMGYQSNQQQYPPNFMMNNFPPQNQNPPQSYNNSPPQNYNNSPPQNYNQGYQNYYPQSGGPPQ